MSLVLAVLGPMEITWAGSSVAIGSTATRALLAYLAVEADRAHAREHIAALLWPDRTQATALANLRQTLVRTRQALPESAFTAVFEVSQHTLRINPAAFELDLARLEALLKDCAVHNHRDIAQCSTCIERLAQAATLYRGEFLEGLALENSQAWDEWLSFKREALHHQALELLDTLARAAENAADYTAMWRYAQRQITLEPWREEAHRQVMRALAYRGERGAALAAFGTFRRVLDTELGIAPAAETIALQAQIEADSLRPFTPAAHIPPALPLAARTNLPIPATRLIGRRDEVEQLTVMLRGATNRLVTLVGPGGVGKTHLASEVAVMLRDMFPDGVFFVALAPISDPEMVTPTIAQVLDVPQTGSEPLLDAIKNYLYKRHLLIVLDNFEQVIGAATVVAELLSAAEHVRVLVTSRTVLRLRGEAEFQVAPLQLVDLDHVPGADEIAEVASVQLFSERAHSVRPTFALTSKNVITVATICALLDGLPLAIELAAARVKIMPPTELLRRLQAARLTILTDSARDMPVRHQTLWGTIDWSYRLLDDALQQFFARLSVFAGSWTSEAAHAVCADDEDNLVTLDALGALLDHSLITRAPTWSMPDADDEVEQRWTLLETIGEYARGRLDASDDGERVRARHAEYYLAMAETAEPILGSSEQYLWLVRLDHEYDNLRQALRWALAGNERGLGLQLASALVRYWNRRGYYTEGRALLETALKLGNDAATTSDSVRAQALYGAAWLASMQGENVRATELFEASIAAQPDERDRARPAMMRVHMGRTARLRGDYERATLLEQEALDFFRAVGDTANQAFASLSLGDVAYDQGDLGTATQLFEEALQLYQQLDNTEDTAWTLKCLAEVAHMQGEWDRATAMLQQCLVYFHDVHDMTGVAQTHLVLGQVAHARGDHVEATQAYRESLRLLFDYGIKIDIAYALEAIPAVTSMSPWDAATLFGTAAAIRSASELPRPPIHSATYDRAVADLRSQLSATDFERAWARGAAMPLEQAVAFALEERPPDLDAT